jgi:hypothetical protein
MPKNTTQTDAMICIGPADHIRQDFEHAMKQIEFAMKTLAKAKGRAARCARNDLDVAREYLAPIFAAVDGRAPPPPASSHARDSEPLNTLH